MRVVGIDLAGAERRDSGSCTLDDGLVVKVCTLRSDDEILREVDKMRPALIAIDAPLSLPLGRCCLRDTCECRNRGHLRQCDRELLNRRIRFFPVTLGPMRKLTERGMRMKRVMEEMDYRVIEVYPGGAQDVWGIPRKQKGLSALREGLLRMVGSIPTIVSHHELDAISSALVGYLYMKGEYEALGNPQEGLMIMPKAKDNP